MSVVSYYASGLNCLWAWLNVAALWLAPQIHAHPHAHEIGAALARDAPLRRALREFLAPLVR